MVPVRFNPWRLGNETEMFVGFFETLAETLDAELTTGAQKVGEALNRYGGLLKPIPFTGGAVGEVTSLHLPPVGSDLLRQVTLETVDVALSRPGTEMSRTEVGEFVSTFDRAVVPRIKTTSRR